MTERDPMPTRTLRSWTLPIVITLATLSALGGLYLGGILSPEASLRGLPVAVVNEDAGPTGDQVVEELLSDLNKSKFDARVLSRSEALRRLDTARLYGAAVIPADFSAKLQAFAQTVARPGHTQRPVITISTNPRAGTLGASIAGQSLTQAMGAVRTALGESLSAQVAQQPGGAPLPSAVSLILARPIEIQATVHNPLPKGTGNGSSAFYYSLLLVLAGFTASIMVGPLVDSLLGHAPARFGPVYQVVEPADISRFRTLLIKWALMVPLALLTSAVYLVIAKALGMPIRHGWDLWLYGALAIAAVGITSTSLIAVLGWIGVVASTLFFVRLPSAGPAFPPEASPSFFRWLDTIEPMHQVFLGMRALLYFDGRTDAGLSHAVTMTAIGLVIGLLLGAVGTHFYDRRGYHRTPGVDGRN